MCAHPERAQQNGCLIHAGTSGAAGLASRFSFFHRTYLHHRSLLDRFFIALYVPHDHRSLLSGLRYRTYVFCHFKARFLCCLSCKSLCIYSHSHHCNLLYRRNSSLYIRPPAKTVPSRKSILRNSLGRSDSFRYPKKYTVFLFLGTCILVPSLFSIHFVAIENVINQLSNCIISHIFFFYFALTIMCSILLAY